MVVVTLPLFLILQIGFLQAKDLGVHGVIHPIAEEDPIALLQQKLKVMEERGELDRHTHHIQERTKAVVERPHPVEGMTKATEARVFTYDPTYTVLEDIKDHFGHVIHGRGTKINPLETVSLSQELVFIDGDDPSQKLWAFDRIQTPEGSNQNGKKVKLILVKGSPLVHSEELGMPVYFDQGGFLTKKLGIKHVPAIVHQSKSKDKRSKDSLYLQIDEVCLSCASASKEEANKGEEHDPL